RHHIRGAVVFVLTLALTTGALAVLHGLDEAPARWLELTVLVAASLVATVTRYVALRTWVFTHRRRTPPPRSSRQTGVPHNRPFPTRRCVRRRRRPRDGRRCRRRRPGRLDAVRPDVADPADGSGRRASRRRRPRCQRARRRARRDRDRAPAGDAERASDRPV